MTVTDESVDLTPDAEDDDDNTTEGGVGRKRDRDFTKFRPNHKEIADFVNANSGLDPVTPNQVKAILTLKTDYANSPEQKAAREQRKAEKAAAEAKYAGMTDEEKAQAKAAEKVENQAKKLQARLDEALARAKAIREGKEATGADLVAQVESAQNGNPAEAAAEAAEAQEGKRRFGRSR